MSDAFLTVLSCYVDDGLHPNLPLKGEGAWVSTGSKSVKYHTLSLFHRGVPLLEGEG